MYYKSPSLSITSELRRTSLTHRSWGPGLPGLQEKLMGFYMLSAFSVPRESAPTDNCVPLGRCIRELRLGLQQEPLMEMSGPHMLRSLQSQTKQSWVKPAVLCELIVKSNLRPPGWLSKHISQLGTFASCGELMNWKVYLKKWARVQQCRQTTEQNQRV